MIEHQPRVRRAAAVRVGAGQRQPARFVALIVEKDESGVGARALDRLTADDAGMHAVLVRDHEAQRAVGVDDVDALDGDLAEVLCAGALPEGRERDEDGEQQGGGERGAREAELAAD